MCGSCVVLRGSDESNACERNERYAFRVPHTTDKQLVRGTRDPFFIMRAKRLWFCAENTAQKKLAAIAQDKKKDGL